jgi:hypothetical protein
MKLKGLIAAPLVALLVTALAAAPQALPAGWTRYGNNDTCTVGTEAVPGAPTPRAFVIECAKGSKGFATAAQGVLATNYAGKRVRLTAKVQGEELAEWGGLWLRGDAKGKVLAFDNMQQRPLTGSFAWREAAVVLQMPAEVDTLYFGFLMAGVGRMRATEFRLEVVPTSVPDTSETRSQPQNLSP